MKRYEPCNEWEDLLALRLEDLSPTDRASLEAHLAICPACATMNDHYRRIQASLIAFPTPVMEAIPYAWKRESGREETEELLQESSKDMLEQYYDYIGTLVRRFVYDAPSHARLEEAYVIDELIQETFIKLHQAFERVPIANPQSYIRAIVRNTYIDRVQKNRVSALAPDTNADAVEVPHKPTVDVGQQELQHLIEKVIEQVLALPPRQRQAMLCWLKEHLDDTPFLAEGLLRHNVDIRNIGWPEDEREKQRLCALLAIAQKKLRTIFSQQLERKGQLEKSAPRSPSQLEVLFGSA